MAFLLNSLPEIPELFLTVLFELTHNLSWKHHCYISLLVKIITTNHSRKPEHKTRGTQFNSKKMKRAQRFSVIST